VVDSTITSANARVTVVTLGDNAYPDGNTNQFKNCYDPTWGGSHLGERSDIALKVVNPNMWTLTRPVVGNHEYQTPGASAYFNYFGTDKAGAPGKGYYSYDRGSWHVVVLNSNCDKVGGCGASSPQGKWLRLSKKTALPAGADLRKPFIHDYDVRQDPPEDVSEEVAAGWAWASGDMVSTPADLYDFIRGYVGGD
jgi:hypothetical protein